MPHEHFDMLQHSAVLKSITPNAEREIVEDARVSSNPDEASRPDKDLLQYLIRNSHWSPFEMANLKVTTFTSRTIGRQIIRHSKLRPQEFSQRYQEVGVLPRRIYSECRMQHPKNRQASIPVTVDSPAKDRDAYTWWEGVQQDAWDDAIRTYNRAIERGIAKEVARDILPEGLTPTYMHLNGDIRTWLHFCGLRRGHGTQIAATLIAESVHRIMREHLPVVTAAYEELREQGKVP